MNMFTDRRISSKQVFPFPQNGDIVWETPPCFTWLLQDGYAGDYEVFVRQGDKVVWKGVTKKNYIVPDIIFAPGNYEWNVMCTPQHQRGWTTFTIADEAVEFLRPSGEDIFEAVPGNVRPRHLFYKRDVPEIIKRQPKDIDTLKRNIEQAYRDGLIPEPPRFGTDPKAMSGRMYMHHHRAYADRNMVACALGWQLLGDRKAGEHAKKLLLEICSWDPYKEASPTATYGTDEIGLSNARTLPAVFDLLYDILTEDEKCTVIDTIIAYAKQCENILIIENFGANPGTSHSGRVPAYIGEAAMVLKGTDVPRDMLIRWLNLAADIYGGIFPFYGSQDGGWAEGPFYASSYTKWYLPFFNAIERYMGVSYLIRPFYQRLMHYMLHFCDPSAEIHPFGDGYWCHTDDEEWPGFMAQNPYHIYAEKFGPQEARSKEKNIKQPDLFLLHLLDVFLPVNEAVDHHITGRAKCAEMFPEAGFVSMRSSLTEDKGCMAVMARASRHGSASHSYPDQGTFCLFYEGTALISPSGYYGSGYGTKHHAWWTNSTKAHNCILVNGEGQLRQSHEPVGNVENCIQQGNRFTALLELSQAYKELDSWKRKIVMDTDNRTLTIYDSISSKSPVIIDWLLHSLSCPEYDENGKLYLQRNKITLEIEPIEGLMGNAAISEGFDVAVDDDAPDWYVDTMPPQYHMTWKTGKRKEHNIVVRMKIKEGL